MSDLVEFYRNGRYWVEADIGENGVVCFKVRGPRDGPWHYGRAGYRRPRWWEFRDDWIQQGIEDAARAAIVSADRLERARQEAEFHTEMAQNEVTAILEQQSALRSLESELAR